MFQSDTSQQTRSVGWQKSAPMASEDCGRLICRIVVERCSHGLRNKGWNSGYNLQWLTCVSEL